MKSQSDLMTVAVDFSPRVPEGRGSRRGATADGLERFGPLQASLRDASSACLDRGLKSTATIAASLGEELPAKTPLRGLFGSFTLRPLL